MTKGFHDKRPNNQSPGRDVAFVILSSVLSTLLFDTLLFMTTDKLDVACLVIVLAPPLMFMCLLVSKSSVHRFTAAFSFLGDGVFRLQYGIHFAMYGVREFTQHSPLIALAIGSSLAILGAAHIMASIALVFSTPLKFY